MGIRFRKRKINYHPELNSELKLFEAQARLKLHSLTEPWWSRVGTKVVSQCCQPSEKIPETTRILDWNLSFSVLSSDHKQVQQI